MLFFAIGILIKRYDILSKYEAVNLKWRKAFFGVLLTIWVLLSVTVMDVAYYWLPLSLLNETILCVLLYETTHLIPKVFHKSCVYLGKVSFSIYLYHMILVTRLFRGVLLDSSSVIAILRPVATVCIMMAIFKLMDYISKKLKCQKIYNAAVGYRV